MDYTSIEEFNARLNALLEDTATETVTAVLADAIRDYSNTIGIITALTESNDNLRDENDRLKRANMELYMRVTTTREELDEEKEEKEIEELKFEDLFDEDGRLI